MIRPTLFAIALFAFAAPVWATAQAQQTAVPALVQRTMPGPGQQALQPLVGTWRVEKRLYVAIGSPRHPAIGVGMITHCKWIGDGRFLNCTTDGAFHGKPYFRTGFLGYNNMDRRYEWVTADNFTPTLMIYKAAARSGVTNPINMTGSFTDMGITGEANVGKNIPMRTVIRIVNNDLHIFEIYFTPPAGNEVLADRMVFTRIK